MRLILVLGLLISTAAIAQPILSMDQQAIAIARNQHRVVASRATTIDRTCQGEHVRISTQTIELMAHQRFEAAKNTRQWTNAQINSLVMSGQEILAIAGDAYLGVADSYLKVRCLNQADEIYRYVLAMPFGIGRSRAQVGIDDVRAARGRR